MKNTLLNKWIVALTVIVLVASCNRKFDIPPANADPEIDANLSIRDLKARYTAIGNFQRINEEHIISGIVIADDRSGNFYKQIIIQDETGGIPVLLDANNVYTQYPVGRRVFILLKGMMLGDYGGTIQIGIDSSRSDDGRFLNLEGIPQTLFDQYIVKGSFNNTITPKMVKPADFTKTINDPLLSTLVQIGNAEFRNADISKTYADPSTNVSAVNFTLATCERQSIILRNSSYARFAAFNVPDGNGIITGIPGIFNGTMQLTIRDTTDVQFTGTRCNGQVPTPVIKSIADLKGYATGDSAIPAGVSIKGVVISNSKNEAAGNYRLQDASGGIQLRFVQDANPAATVGDSLTVTVGGLSLSVYNGGLQVNDVSMVVKSGTGIVTPRPVTIADIKTNQRAWESTLVTISDINVTTGISNNIGSNFIISDGTGELTTFVRHTAGITMPAAATSITGYVSLFQSTSAGAPLETQITLRNSNDFTGGTGGYFVALYDFSSVTNASGSIDPGPTPAIEGLSFSPFSAAGVSANSSAGGRFSFTNWPLDTATGPDILKGAPDLNKYYEVILTPHNGKKFDISKISFTLQRSATGIRQVVLRSGMDGFSANLAASVSPLNDNLSVTGNNVFQVTDATTAAQDGCIVIPGAGFTNISSAVRIRLYGFNAKAAGGTFSIDNVKIEGMVR
ncbi:DUF5689 domain-containing protein [Niabella sp. 22666]|uniref:DUF5689 domain-containing protein n=1 Tax=Niabella sp. 22666 TaxID=3453954 RepID=UPI003F84B552